MKQAIWFIVVTFYPDREQLISLVNALKDWPLVIVDNTGSNQLPGNKIEWSKNVNLIQNSINLGYGAGANAGITYALRNGAQWLVVLNQDLKVNATGIKHLTKKLEKISPAIAGPFAGSLDSKRWTTILPATTAKIDYISGSCIAIHRKVIEKTGGFYAPYFMYYEDVDLCVRVQKLGFPLIKIDLSGIAHQETSSLGSGSLLHQYYLARNHLLFVERQAPLGVKIHELLRLPKTLAAHHTVENRGAIEGIADFARRRFGKRYTKEIN